MRSSWSHKLKRDAFEKKLGTNHFARLCAHKPIPYASRRWLAVRRILFKVSLYAVYRAAKRRRLYEADISTSVALEQRSADSLEETIWSFIVMRSSCQSSRTDGTFHHSLPVFRVVRCSSVHCFQTRITEDLYRNTWAAISRSDNPPVRRPIVLPRSNFVGSWNFYFFWSGGILRSL